MIIIILTQFELNAICSNLLVFTLEISPDSLCILYVQIHGEFERTTCTTMIFPIATLWSFNEIMVTHRFCPTHQDSKHVMVVTNWQ